MMDNPQIILEIASQKARMLSRFMRADVLHIGAAKLEALMLQIGAGAPSTQQRAAIDATKADGVPRLLGSVMGLDLYTSDDDEECRVAEWGE